MSRAWATAGPEQLGLAKRGQLHRPDAVGEVAGPLPGQLQSEPRLATATSPGQRQQPRAAQERAGLGQLALAADEARQLLREVVRVAWVSAGEETAAAVGGLSAGSRTAAAVGGLAGSPSAFASPAPRVSISR